MGEKKKKKKTVEVDQDFFDTVVSSNKKIIERLVELENKPEAPVPSISPSEESGYAFQCMEYGFFDKKPETPQEMTAHKDKIVDFRKKLENLIKESKVGLVNAIFIKKL